MMAHVLGYRPKSPLSSSGLSGRMQNLSARNSEDRVGFFAVELDRPQGARPTRCIYFATAVRAEFRRNAYHALSQAIFESSGRVRR
jgi:hypothetical protein